MYMHNDAQYLKCELKIKSNWSTLLEPYLGISTRRYELRLTVPAPYIRKYGFNEVRTLLKVEYKNYREIINEPKINKLTTFDIIPIVNV